MANYSELLNDINAAIYENNDQEIDALEVRAILREMVTSLGSGFLFKGIATPSSPGTSQAPDQNVFYIATTAGTYTYLGGLVVAAGEVAFLCYDGTWTKKSSALLSTGSIVDNLTTEDATKPLSAKQGKVLADAGAATAAEVTALGHKVDGLALGKFYGFFPAAADLPAGDEPGYAYVGASSPFAIYVFKNGAWSNSGSVYEPSEGNGEDIDTDSQGKLQFANRPTTYGMGYKILRKDASFASQVTAGDTIYEIRYDFDLGGASVTIPSGCVLRFNGGSISNGTIALNSTILEGAVSIDALTSGTIGNKTFFSEWFTDIDKFVRSASATRGYSNIDVANGEYTISYALNLDGNISIDFHNSKINVAQNVATGFVNINRNETDTLLTTLSAAANIGDKSISVTSASGIKRGDLLLLLDETANSYNSYNVVDPGRNYKQGEFIMVYEVSGSVIQLVNPLYGFYVSDNLANCKLYRVNLYSCEIKNANFFYNKASGTLEAPCFRIDNTINLHIQNIKSNGFDIAMDIKKAYNLTIEDCELIASLNNTGPGGVALDQYGVVVSSSQNGIVRNIFGSFSNHVFATVGGVFPTRNFYVSRVVSRSVHQGYCGVNLHGATEYVTFDDCVVAGIDFGGDYVTIKNSKIYECYYNNGAANYAISTGEVTGYNITIENCNISGRWYDRLTHFGGINEKTSNFVIKNTNWTNYDSSEPMRRPVTIGGVAQDVFVLIENCTFKTSARAMIIWKDYFPELVIKNSRLVNFLLDIKSSRSITFENNDVETSYMFIYNETTGSGNLTLRGNRIVQNSTNSAITTILMIQNSSNVMPIFDFSYNYIKCTDGASTLTSTQSGGINQLFFRGNITHQSGGSGYIQITANYAWVSPTPELGNKNHIVINSSNKSDGTILAS